MQGGATRLETLYRDVGPALLAYLRRGLGDATAAEDVLQDTFFQAARCPERVLAAASPRAWLFGVARHAVLTLLRRRRRTEPLPDALAAAVPREDPRLESVRQAIATLPDTFREVLELRLRAELSYAEIAEVLQIPVGTVRSRLHHALARLRVAVVPDEK